MTPGDPTPLALAPVRRRLRSIDALRGIVMFLMLVDHTRETFFLHQQVGDPVDVTTVSPALFFSRFLASFCAPAFVLLTGLSAALYHQTHSTRQTASFLLKRGLFLIALELVVIGTAWTGVFPPQTFYLQIIWCIGLCMIALSALLTLPRPLQLALSVLIIAGHNLLTGLTLPSSSPFYLPWAVVYQRDWIELGGGLVARTSYPILPWIGVILLGYTLGPLYHPQTSPRDRGRWLQWSGFGMLLLFLLLRTLNYYGDQPWQTHQDLLTTAMAYLSLTKYPPSLLFLLPTLGASLLTLRIMEHYDHHRITALLARLGGAPLFFYILHLYVLKALYLIAVALFGTNQGEYYGFDHFGGIWLWALLLTPPLYTATGWFADLKKRRRDLTWLKYL